MSSGAGASTAPPQAAGVAPRSAAPQLVRDYVTLNKPPAPPLLLLTTVTTMYVAGDPSLSLIFLTCLGGALSAGGAGALHRESDRHVDQIMARTATPPGGPLRADPPRRRDRLRSAPRGLLLRPAGAGRQPAGGGALALGPARLR